MKTSAHASPVLIILPIFLLAAAGSLYAYLYHETSVSVGRSAAAEAAVNSAAVAAGTDSGLTAEYKSTAAKRAQLSGLFVPADNAVVFIEALEAIGPASGAQVSISAIHAEPAGDSGSLGSVAAQVTASGSWSSVMKALILAESLGYQSSVDDLALIESDAAAAAGSAKSATVRSWQASFQVTAATISAQ